MDVVSSTWFSEMEMEEYNIFDQFDFTSDHDVLEENNMKQSLSSESNSSYSAITVNNNNNNQSNDTTSGTDSVLNNSHESFEIILRPSKQLKTSSVHHLSNKPSNYYNPPRYINSSSQILSFENPKASNNLMVKPKKEEVSQVEEIKCFKPKDSMVKRVDHDHDHHHHYAPKVVNKEINNSNKRSYSSMIRTPSPAQDHIMAERKRREKLSQQFIALSAIVPGLKKMDKASVLGDAIKYLKELKERVETLEDQTKKRTVESVVLVRKSQLVLSTTDDDTSSSNESSDDGAVPEESVQYPEIEARVSDKDVLIRIHCHKRDRGLVVKILTEVEKLHLSIVNSSVMPFGNSTLDITIIAQMDNEFNMKVKDLVKNLRLALLKIM